MARAFASLLALGLLAAACGGGGSAPATPTPGAGITPQPTAASPTVPARTIDLAVDAPATAIWGADAGDYHNDLPGLSSGDVNGDGLDDLLVGARWGDGPDNARKDAGEAYLILGRAELPATIDLAAGEQDVTVFGAAPNDQLGFSAILADISGDGLDDVIVGAPVVARADGAQAGAVYVILGGEDLPATIDLSETAADLTVVGGQTQDLVGDSLAAGDVNGDGTDDLIVGSVFARIGGRGAQVGAAYVLFGGSDLTGTRDMALSEYDAALFGAEEFDEVGDNVASGDVNGDGIDDIIATAEAADGPDNERSVAGDVYIVYGSRDLEGDIEVSRGEPDVTLYGAEQNDTLGFSLAVGDVNEDGAADLFMTARLADGPDNSIQEAGEVHILYGGDSLPEVVDAAAGETSAYLYGPDGADLFGVSLGTIDADGDGRPELWASSGYGDGPANDRRDAGEVYVLDASALSGARSILTAPLKLVVYGAQATDGFGSAVAAGDLDGDGRQELIVLADAAAGPEDARPDAGELYIIYIEDGSLIRGQGMTQVG